MNLKYSNWIVGSLIVLANVLYFIPTLIIVIYNNGGPMGFGLFPGLISIITLLFIFPALLTLKTRFKNSTGLLIVNTLGLLWISFWFYLLISTPLID